MTELIAQPKPLSAQYSNANKVEQNAGPEPKHVEPSKEMVEERT